MLLLVVEDRHAESALRRAIASARAVDATFVVLTADARLAMRLRREHIEARLPIDTFQGDPAADHNVRVETGDRTALEGVTAAFGSYATFGGTDFGPYLQYTLIPSFIRAVRNLTAAQDLVTSGPPERMVLIAGGALVQAARLVALQRSIPIERVDGDLLTRAQHAFARLRAGRATKWVNTEFRALILEPGFLSLLFAKAFWRRLAGPAPQPPRPDVLIVVGDRFTADVINRLRNDTRQIILAGATQPGRALFEMAPSLVPIESFGRWSDLLRTAATMIDAAARSISLATDAEHGRRFVVDGVPYWPLVRRTAALHILIWIQKLRHLQTLAARAAHASPRARLLTSSDVTAYNRVLIDTVRRLGVTSTGIQHGITGEPNGHSIVRVDTLATWGEQAERWYRDEAAKLGREQQARFVVTGNPRFDSLAARVVGRQSSVVSPQSSVPSPQSPFTVCVCTAFLSDFSTSASEYENLAMIDAVLEWARTKNDVRVIHKMHPGEELEYYAEAGRALGWDPLKLTTIREPILHDILQQSHVLVSVYSSTVLESIALGTPAIVFDAVVQRNLVNVPGFRLRDVPGVTIAYSLAETQQQLDMRKSGPLPDRASLRSSAELRGFLSVLDGEATARVAALLE